MAEVSQGLYIKITYVRLISAGRHASMLSGVRSALVLNRLKLI
jgi:hypothetical protein